MFHNDREPIREAPLLAAGALIVAGMLLLRSDPETLSMPRRRGTLASARRRFRRGDRVGAVAQETRDRVADVLPSNLAAGIGRSVLFAGIGIVLARVLDRLADEADLVARQRHLGDRLGDHGVRHLQHDALAAHHLRQVGLRQHRPHARHRAGRFGIDRADARMGVGRAHKGRVKRAGQLDVVGETARAGQEGRVLDPLDRRSEGACGHEVPSPARNVLATWSVASTMPE